MNEGDTTDYSANNLAYHKAYDSLSQVVSRKLKLTLV